MKTPKQTILFEVAAYLDRYGSDVLAGEFWTQPPTDPRNGNAEAWGFSRNGIPYKPAEWLERRMDRATTHQFSKALEELGAEGLIVRVRNGARTVALQPTSAGLAEGVRLIRRETKGKYPTAGAVAAALDLAKWADAKLREAAKA